jgi:hypothetical protein
MSDISQFVTTMVVTAVTVTALTTILSYFGSYLIKPLKPTRRMNIVFVSLVVLEIISLSLLIPLGESAEAQGLYTQFALATTLIDVLCFPIHFLGLLSPAAAAVFIFVAPVASPTLFVYIFCGLRRLAKKSGGPKDGQLSS